MPKMSKKKSLKSESSNLCPQALDHRLPQVAPLDARMFQGPGHSRDPALAPDRLASNTLTEMYQRMRTFNQ